MPGHGADMRSFEEALGDLISDYVEAKRASRDDMISAMELQIMALKEERDE